MTANRHTLLTLFFIFVTLVLLLPAVDAHGAEGISRHRSSRMLKVRGPPPALRRDLLGGLGLGKGGDSGGSSDAGGAANAAGAPTDSASPSAGGSGTPTPSGSVTSNSPASTPSPSAGNGNGGGGLGAIGSGLSSIASVASSVVNGGGSDAGTGTGSSLAPTGTGTDTGTDSVPTTTSTPPPTSSAPSATNVSSAPESSPPSSSSVAAPSPTASTNVPITTPLTSQQQQQASTQTRFSTQTIIILAATAGSIVAAGLIWTIVRKWKFRASRDRLATIDWAPDNQGSDMSERHRLSFGSVRSGSAVGSGADANSQFRRNMFAPDAPSLAPDFPPAHDFTAGPARGPTPQPGLMRGPSAHRGQYGY